jgi:cardiolipin synthase
MLFYMESGEVVAVTGSHNFIASGGTLGTREVALQTNDPRVIQQLENFLHDKVQE